MLNSMWNCRLKHFLLEYSKSVTLFSSDVVIFFYQMEDDLADLMQEIGYSSCSR